MMTLADAKRRPQEEASGALTARNYLLSMMMTSADVKRSLRDQDKRILLTPVRVPEGGLHHSHAHSRLATLPLQIPDAADLLLA